MRFLEKIQTNNKHKILLYFFLLLVIFNKPIAYAILNIYNSGENDK